jgi:hypothetical protein
MDDYDGIFQLNLTILEYDVICSKKGGLQMRRLIATMACAISSVSLPLSSVPVTAQETPSKEGKWKAVIDPASKARIKFFEDFWDFGSIPKESVVKHDFGFQNTGSDTLLITRVKPTCGCTTAPLSSDKIAPGEAAEISASLNTKKLHGTIKKSILIDSNDPISPYLKISFRARINDTLATLQSNPEVADFATFKGSDKAKFTLSIANRGSETADLVILDKPPDEILKASFRNGTLAPGDSTVLELELVTELSPGPFVSSLTLEAEGKPDSRMTIPIKGVVTE